MDEAVSFLKEWFIRFLENRDLVRKNIASIDGKEGFDFVVNYRDKAVNFLIMPILEGNSLEKINNNENFGIITLNNSQNIRFSYNCWKKIAEMRFLSLYFVNPFSNTDKAWILCPYAHDRICDKNSLWLGLKAMAEMVEPINYEKVMERLKLER
ncbi:hypothetical protein HYU50_02435 [Candidatus Woesearchaeota archaeon]|nr:hypothetical protein [Candidatus Woesearchaeota archaeon]